MNDNMVDYFNCGRAVYQGDPLLSLLFCLIKEVCRRDFSIDFYS